MSASNKRSLIFIIIFLLLTNLGVLAYFLMNKKSDKPAQNKSQGLGSALKKDVGFDDPQVASYKKMKDEQWKKFKPMLNELYRAKDSLYKMLSNESASDSSVNAVALYIGEKQKAVELQAYIHFKQIRTLCRPDQLVKYDSVILENMRKLRKGQKGDQKKKDKK
jgi:hypothetical protein